MTVPDPWLDITELAGERLLLEPLRVEHAAEMAPLLDDPLLHTYIGGAPPTAEELKAQYARQVIGRSTDGTERWLNWIIRRRDDGQVVGYVQATVSIGTVSIGDVSIGDVSIGDVATAESEPSADVAWVIGSAAQGQGYAVEAARLMVTWLRAQGVRTITAHVHPEHRASGAVAGRIGLHPTADVVDGEIRWQS